MRAGAWCGVLAGMLLAGCGGPPPPGEPAVPVEGSPRDVGTIAGRWAGEFVGARDGRRGTIGFALDPGSNTAQGSVVIEGAAAPLGCSDPVTTAVQGPAEGQTVLRLGRVVVGDGSVAGWLETYRDFERGCPVDTWFEGELRGEMLRGMFFAHPAVGDTVRLGTWWAKRQ